MITGTTTRQIDSIWNAFWSGGISNPLEVTATPRATAANLRFPRSIVLRNRLILK